VVIMCTEHQWLGDLGHRSNLYHEVGGGRFVWNGSHVHHNPENHNLNTVEPLITDTAGEFKF
jgi:hypothetical protein